MNLSKYPPSIAFTLATLGPMAILCSFADKWQGWLKDTLIMFGRVPLVFYIAHFYLIHTLVMIYGVMLGHDAIQFARMFGSYPDGFGTGLGGVYLVWLMVLMILYPLCKWMASLKQRRKDWWLSYL